MPRRYSDDKYIIKYDAIAANNKYIPRRSKNHLKANDKIISIIKSDMNEFNSITSIAGRWSTTDCLFPSATKIYNWVKDGSLILSKSCKNAFKLKQTYHRSKSNSKECEENTKTFHQRSNKINKRLKFVHWELDLI